MHLTYTVAALVLLGTAAAEEYVPVHKRFSYDAVINDFSYLGMLSKRDSCSDAFGRLSVIANEDKCYVDQASACGEDSAVACTNLQVGTDEACCPKLTTCDPGLEATKEYVRCNINRGDLLVAAKASGDAESKSATSTQTSSSTKTTSSTTTSSAEPKTTVPESQATQTSETATPKSSSISGGAIGGIVVGVIAVVGGAIGLAIFFMRRSKKAKYEAANQTPNHTIAQYYQEQQLKHQQQQGYWPQGSPEQQGGYGYSPQPPPSELPDQRPPVELDAGNPPR
ncbi:Fc.00g107950.m01.CDS01 [Cosmosporella sp. VM-42]